MEPYTIRESESAKEEDIRRDVSDVREYYYLSVNGKGKRKFQ